MPRLSEMDGHEADERHPAGHLRGLMDLLADADGACRLLTETWRVNRRLRTSTMRSEFFLLNCQEAAMALPSGRRSTLTGGWSGPKPR